MTQTQYEQAAELYRDKWGAGACAPLALLDWINALQTDRQIKHWIMIYWSEEEYYKQQRDALFEKSHGKTVK